MDNYNVSIEKSIVFLLGQIAALKTLQVQNKVMIGLLAEELGSEKILLALPLLDSKFEALYKTELENLFHALSLDSEEMALHLKDLLN